MSAMDDVQQFITASREISRPEDLHALLQDITREMGFDFFALIHHVDLRPLGGLQDHVVTEDFVALSDYPQSWVDQYIDAGIVSNDPVLLASQRTNVGFAWDELEKYIDVTEAHRRIVKKSQKAGISNGFTVPANVPGELNGSCNFAVGPQHDAPRSNFPMAQLVGSFAFQAARQMTENIRGLNRSEKVRLTSRQLECIALVAQGKSDWEIGNILGISPTTVTDYINDARRRYNVPRRIQLVMRTIYEGLIPFSELL